MDTITKLYAIFPKKKGYEIGFDLHSDSITIEKKRLVNRKDF